MDENEKYKLLNKVKENTEQYINIFKGLQILLSTNINTQENHIINLLMKYRGGTEEVFWKSQLSDFKENTNKSQLIIKRLNELMSSFNEENFFQNIASQYLKFIDSEILSDPNIEEIKHPISRLNKKIDLHDLGLAYDEKYQFINNISHVLNHSKDLSETFLRKLAHLDTFEHFKSIDHSIVIIGANGSGKSSFSRNAKKALGGNVAIISAQKLFTLQKISTIPVGTNTIQGVRNYQSNEKLGNKWGSYSEYGQDFYNLILALIAEHNTQANDFYSKNGGRESSILEQTISLWNEIIQHRSMSYQIPDIKIQTTDKSEYEFPQLSDGEKAVFYYIANIMIAKKDSYIIIDEPENHLHSGIVSKLWDKLEKNRDDCKFIYLTHDLKFASSRFQAKKLWSKSYKEPAKWDIVPLPSDRGLPEELLMEIIGFRKKILFCEGEFSSTDYNLYKILLPNYDIRPVGGHINVINYTRAFNRSTDLFNNSAIGIIDGDFHSEEAKLSWEKESIYSIDVHEVENILCDEHLLRTAHSNFCSEQEALESAKNQLFLTVHNNKSHHVTQYVTQKINEILKNNFIKEANAKEDLKVNFNESINLIDIDKIYNERLSLFDNILQNREYDLAIKHINHKGLIHTVGGQIVKDYKKRILRLIESKPEMVDYLKKKYFSKI